MTIGSDRRDQLIDRLAHRLDSWGLGAPAIAFLEVHKPLGFLASQTLLVFQPLLAPFLDSDSLEEYSTLLEDAASVERMICRLEELRGDEYPQG